MINRTPISYNNAQIDRINENERMNFLIFILFFTLAIILFIYGLAKFDLDGGIALAIAGITWFALALASFNIEFPYVIPVNGTVQTYIYRDYSTASAWLFAGLGVVSFVISFFAISGLLRRS